MHAGSKPQPGTSLAASSISRRSFLSAAAATAAMAALPGANTFGAPGPEVPAILHLARRSRTTASIHSYRAEAARAEFLGATEVSAFAAHAGHPTLPLLYVLRDTPLWQHLPRAVVATYAVADSTSPLSLIAETPLSLSATGACSLAVSACGRMLMVAASGGRAWNALSLDAGGMPAEVAIARKQSVIDTAPHAIAFSPRALLALGSERGGNGTGRLTLLSPSQEAILLLARSETRAALHALPPVWSADGEHILTTEAGGSILASYAVQSQPQWSLTPAHRTSLDSPVSALLPDAESGGIVTLRLQGTSSALEMWSVESGRMQCRQRTRIAAPVLALAQHSHTLWLATGTRLLALRGLRQLGETALPPASAAQTWHAVVTRTTV